MILVPLVVVASAATALGVLRTGSTVSNDRFVDAIAVTHSVNGTTVDATADADEVAAAVAQADQRVVWFSWTAPVSGWAYLSPASGLHPTMPQVKAYVGSSIDTLDLLDTAATSSEPGVAQGISIPAVAGTSYRLAVIGDGAGALFDLVLTQPGAGAPLNDEPTGAVDVGPTVAAATAAGSAEQIVIDTLGGATAATGEAPTGGQAAAHSLWYSWHPGHSGGTASFAASQVYGSTGPFRVAVFTAADTDGTPGIGVADLTPAPGGSTGGPISVVGGTAYLISVDGPESFFRLTVTSTGVASDADTTPPIVDCADRSTGWSAAPTIIVSCTATDTDSALALASDASFELSVTTTDGAESDSVTIPARPVCDVAGNCADAGPITGIHVDRKAPTTECDPVAASWTSDPPSVHCTATDGGSGLADASDASRTFTASAPPGTEAELSIPGADICDLSGNCATVGPFGPIRVDRKTPELDCATPPSLPATSQIEVTCTAVDAGSGLAQSTDDTFTLTTEVPAGTATDDAETDAREVCDLAGNCATAGPITGLSVDLAPPSVTCTPDDHNAVDAWRSAPFGFTCAIADVGSGLTAGTPTTVTLTATLPDGAASAAITTTSSGPTEVCDVAGSCVPVGPVTDLRIDRQAPNIECAPAGDGWHASPATVKCPVSDGDGAGIDGAATVALTATLPGGSEGPVDTGAAQVCDRVGNCATAGPVIGVLIDHRPPQVSCATPAPAYRIEARITCEATDGGSGLASDDDTSFVLTSTVGSGAVDHTALTGSRQVCDIVGSCTAAGPFTVDVDLRSGPGAGPTMTLPDRVTVISTLSPKGPTGVPYLLPDVPEASALRCRPEPGTVLKLGWSTLVCEAISPTGITVDTFPLVVKALPSLASSTTGTPGGAWRAVGVGFAPGSAVTVEISGIEVAAGQAGGDGRAGIDFTIPDTVSTGDHQLVIRGHDIGGDPLLIVAALSTVAAPPGSEPPTRVPGGAPSLPPTGPAVPADPGPPPLPPKVGHIPRATNPTTPSTTTTTLVLPTGDTTTTLPEDQSTDAPPGVADPPAPEPTGFSFTRLPTTGADIAAWVVVGLVLAAVGFALTRIRRRPAPGDPKG